MTESPSPTVWPHSAPIAGEEYGRMSIFDHYLHRYAATIQEELTLIEYLELCRKEPASYATPAERMLHATKTKATHIPYKGAAELLTSLLGYQVDFAFDSGLTMPHVKSEKLRIIGVVSTQRSPLFPDTPTLAEAGIDVEGDAVFGVYAPAGVSRDIVLRLNREIGRIMQTPEARAVLATFAAEVVTMSPDEFAAVQQRDRDKFGAFIREANIRAD